MDRKALEQMLAQGIDNPLLRYTLGTLCLQEKSPEQAIIHLEKALAQEPGHSASWKSYAKALTLLERHEEAIDAYLKGIEVAEGKGDVQAIKEMEVFLKRLQKSP
jgi:uncharacterized protein HemY